MSKEAASALLALSQSIEKGENNRERVLDQISLLNSTIAQMHEGLVDERRIRDQLAQLNSNIIQLSDDLRADRNQRTDIVASELRGLSSSIATMIDVKTLRGKGD